MTIPFDEVFGRWMLDKLQRKRRSLKCVLFINENSFSSSITSNEQNARIWRHKYSHIMVEGFHKKRFTLNIWPGISESLHY